ncbi:phage minor capsid protein [Blautia pseudococcoides]|uniref:phage minor capsid protein n=2 Tax=Blautia pseudococcoides TaxID=1796616 RepID=UPI00148B0472|nr:phage minor capsid protein [Blautia pseudococcoides]QJU15758.1 minor capsid protein [Blautia pseudococcoides]
MANDYDIGKAFQAIEDELMASMVRNMKRHRAWEDAEGMHWEQWQALQLKSLEKYKKDNQKRFKGQFKDINKEIESLIYVAHQQGGMDQEKAILRAIKKGFPAKKVSSGATAEFFKINDRKLDALIHATTNDMQKAETAVLRMANDKYRKVIFNAQVYANTGAGTYEKAVDMATKDMLSAGLNCVEYANGARHTLSDYADMAIRTASKRAYLQGEGQKRQEWGLHLVIMNKRGNPCPKCLPFVGKVLIDDVWSGGSKADGDYPLMSSAISAGLYHPRCKDGHTTYFPGISTLPDDKFSKQELEEIEVQSKQEVKQQYIERQRKKYRRLARYSLNGDNKLKYSLRAKEFEEQDIMQGAKGFPDRNTADDYYRNDIESLWEKLSGPERNSLWKYTGPDYADINVALRTEVPATDTVQGYVKNMTAAIRKSRIKENVWVRRGISQRGLEKFLDIDTVNNINDVIGKTFVEKGFMSTAVASDAGFEGINLKICLPEGTQAIYAEPFSRYGGTNNNGTWDGKQKGRYVGSEAEMIIQRGSEFRVKSVDTDSDGNIKEVVLMLIAQI